MNNRQKRLCRALLDHYDASGAQPYPLSQLAKKTGYDTSDIYDKDSQSGDLWPFDAKARGNYAGMLAFTVGKNTTVTLTSSGLVGLEKLCNDESAPVKEKARETPPPKPAAPAPKPTVPAPERVSTTPPRSAPATPKTAKPFPAAAKSVPTTPPVAPAPAPAPTPAPVKITRSAPKFSTPAIAPAQTNFSSDEITDARNRFKYWLQSNPVGQELLESLTGNELVEAAFEKFFSEFLKGK